MMVTINERIREVRAHFCKGKNKLFADTLNKQPNTTSNWCRDGYSVGNGVAQEIADAFGVSVDWLLTGRGGMFIKDSEDSDITAKIPLIPNEAFAGYGAYQYQDLPIEEFYQIREFGNASFLLRVSGDSMSPRYHSGDLVACKKVEELTYWQWHRIYAICTKNQGILIKRVEKSETQDAVTCVSENPAYDAFELNKQEIVSVALVLGGVVME